MTDLHQSHPDIIKRLRRAEGHLRSTIGMIEQGRACLELAQQLHAVESAIREAKKALIHDHLDNCLEAAVGPASREARTPIDEFKALTKYL
ncbi:MAG: metal-sensing transcriptional repressor [Stellaceae bacterium]